MSNQGCLNLILTVMILFALVSLFVVIQIIRGVFEVGF